MSVTTRVTVSCDEYGCEQSLTWSRRNGGGLNMTTAIAGARRAGWSVADSEHVHCPEHRQQQCEFEGYRLAGGPQFRYTLDVYPVRCAIAAGHRTKHRKGAYVLVEERVTS